MLATVITANQPSRVLAETKREYALGLGKVVQKAESYLSKEHKYSENDLEVCNIAYHRTCRKSKNTNIVESYWVWEVGFASRKNFGKVLGGGFTVVMADTPSFDLIKIMRGK
ncbi:MAG: hypothetical protein ACI4R9_03120 [Kiritimatiellia bacterium]